MKQRKSARLSHNEQPNIGGQSTSGDQGLYKPYRPFDGFSNHSAQGMSTFEDAEMDNIVKYEDADTSMDQFENIPSTSGTSVKQPKEEEPCYSDAMTDNLILQEGGDVKVEEPDEYFMETTGQTTGNYRTDAIGQNPEDFLLFDEDAAPTCNPAPKTKQDAMPRGNQQNRQSGVERPETPEEAEEGSVWDVDPLMYKWRSRTSVTVAKKSKTQKKDKDDKANKPETPRLTDISPLATPGLNLAPCVLCNAMIATHESLLLTVNDTVKLLMAAVVYGMLSDEVADEVVCRHPLRMCKGHNDHVYLMMCHAVGATTAYEVNNADSYQFQAAMKVYRRLKELREKRDGRPITQTPLGSFKMAIKAYFRNHIPRKVPIPQPVMPKVPGAAVPYVNITELIKRVPIDTPLHVFLQQEKVNLTPEEHESLIAALRIPERRYHRRVRKPQKTYDPLEKYTTAALAAADNARKETPSPPINFRQTPKNNLGDVVYEGQPRKAFAEREKRLSNYQQESSLGKRKHDSNDDPDYTLPASSRRPRTNFPALAQNAFELMRNAPEPNPAILNSDSNKMPPPRKYMRIVQKPVGIRPSSNTRYGLRSGTRKVEAEKKKDEELSKAVPVVSEEEKKPEMDYCNYGPVLDEVMYQDGEAVEYDHQDMQDYYPNEYEFVERKPDIEQELMAGLIPKEEQGPNYDMYEEMEEKPDVSQLNAEMEKKPDITQPNAEIAETKPDLAETKPNLAATKPDLVETKPDLAGTKPDLAELKEPKPEMLSDDQIEKKPDITQKSEELVEKKPEL